MFSINIPLHITLIAVTGRYPDPSLLLIGEFLTECWFQVSQVVKTPPELLVSPFSEALYWDLTIGFPVLAFTRMR